eukprot:7719723-Pyramimonas_sp.AAC.1
MRQVPAAWKNGTPSPLMKARVPCSDRPYMTPPGSSSGPPHRFIASLLTTVRTYRQQTNKQTNTSEYRPLPHALLVDRCVTWCVT